MELLGRRVDENGEILEPTIVYTRKGQIVRVIDLSERQYRITHTKLRSSRDVKRAMKRLDPSERSMLFTLLQYVQWETNIVVGDGEIGEKNVALRYSDIDKISGMSKPTRIKVIKSLEEKKVIAYLYDASENKRIGIMVNPMYGYKGRKPPSASWIDHIEDAVDVDED